MDIIRIGKRIHELKKYYSQDILTPELDLKLRDLISQLDVTTKKYSLLSASSSEELIILTQSLEDLEQELTNVHEEIRLEVAKTLPRSVEK